MSEETPVLRIHQTRSRANPGGMDVRKIIGDDVLPFRSRKPAWFKDEFEIRNWAANNMNWDDVAGVAFKISDAPPVTCDDFREAWAYGVKEVTGPWTEGDAS